MTQPRISAGFAQCAVLDLLLKIDRSTCNASDAVCGKGLFDQQSATQVFLVVARKKVTTLDKW